MKVLALFFAGLAVASAASRSSMLVDRGVLYPHLVNDKVSMYRPLGSAKIVGGTETTPHAYPWMVALNIDLLYFCGGTIISDNYIMTAGHCCDGSSSVVATAGAHNQATSEPTQQELSSSTIKNHEDYNGFTISNDICVVEMNGAWSMDENVQAISFADAEPAVGEIVKAVGWGKTSDFGGVSATLNEVDVPVCSDADAEAVYGDLGFESKVCIDSTGGMGTCNGDSGGPLVDSNMGQFGITSFGSSAGCTAGYPDCFTSIPFYREWIRENAGV